MLKNITLSAEEATIQQARQQAAREHRSLSDAFREWLSSYARRQAAGEKYDRLMEKLPYVRPGGKFTREEMNER